jgi:hypothetical protein
VKGAAVCAPLGAGRPNQHTPWESPEGINEQRRGGDWSKVQMGGNRWCEKLRSRSRKQVLAARGVHAFSTACCYSASAKHNFRKPQLFEKIKTQQNTQTHAWASQTHHAHIWAFCAGSPRRGGATKPATERERERNEKTRRRRRRGAMFSIVDWRKEAHMSQH